MLLVLGRPGSGCSTFLKAVANKRGGFAGVEGEVSYGGIPAKEQAKHYRGEVNYNEEDDLHFPTLTVEQTLDFSLLNKQVPPYCQQLKLWNQEANYIPRQDKKAPEG